MLFIDVLLICFFVACCLTVFRLAGKGLTPVLARKLVLLSAFAIRHSADVIQSEVVYNPL